MPIEGLDGEAAAPTPGLLDVIADFDKGEGWPKLSEAEALFKFAAAVKAGCIVEVGSLRGRSTVALCAGASVGGNVPVYAIDPHEKFTGTKGATAASSSNRRAFFRNMLNTRMDGQVRLLNIRSEMVADQWKKPVELLVMNGDRRHEAARREFAAWVPHLRNGAAVIFKDGHDGGPAAVIAEFTEKSLLAPESETGSLSVFRFMGGKTESDDFTIRKEGAPVVDPVLKIDRAVQQPGLNMETVAYNVYYGKGGKYLYQSIPKCACTSIKTILLELEGLPVDADEWRRHDKSKNMFPGAHHLSPEALDDLFQGRTDTFKFVVVRDPYTRIASAYQDKIRMLNKQRSKFWIRSVQQAAAQQDVAINDDISFEEFVRVISAQPVEEMDAHWRPQYFEGRFGLIKYDYIAHLEMLSSDLPYILERIEAPDHLHRKAAEPHNVTNAHMALWAEVSAAARLEFLETFAIDFDTLHYPYRTHLNW